MRAFESIGRIFGHLFKGRFSLALFTLARELPNWLFRYNKAWLFSYGEGWTRERELSQFGESENPPARVKVATTSDVEDVVRICRVERERVLYLLNSGATCFLGSVGDTAPSSANWCAHGRCFVRGLGFEHDFAPDGSYGFWSFTLPEARGKGLHSAILVEKTRIEQDRGFRKFYGIIELNNERRYLTRLKMGYNPLMTIFYVKLLFLEISAVRHSETNKLAFRVFLREPRDEVTII
ncbi:MAG: hypothetical protein AMJ46_10260 [Latescibacteria bacterium DG_63]|nr:MAG: hypothetical protein AMJ46_10260 [Latescibacteria bacterium DG_63]